MLSAVEITELLKDGQIETIMEIFKELQPV